MTDLSSLIPLTAYARTSTDDQQSPEESLRWQLSRANALIIGRAEIVSVTHDTDVSRSVPWSRRPEAARLIAQLPNPARGWSGIVVGEPQRAFGSAGQVQNIMPQLAHFGVQLWVPEVGGPVDPDSEAHDLLMSMFGGLSKAERNRLRVRVRTSMKAMAPEGRYLGGRPPYGYSLDRTGVPHPNPEKARQGIQLTDLVIDPETAQVVEQIFAWRVEGVGFRAIAARLSEQGVPCPSAADRQRNPHRHGRAWSASAVRAIVMNPKYKGQGIYGRYHKVERLYDVNDPAAGNVTRMSPAPTTEIIETDGIVAPIVTEMVWRQAQTDRAPAIPGPRADRPEDSRYALRGLLVCSRCGRRMQGHVVSRRSASATNAPTATTTRATTVIPRRCSWPRIASCPPSMTGWRTCPHPNDSTPPCPTSSKPIGSSWTNRPSCAGHVARAPTPASGSISTSPPSTPGWTPPYLLSGPERPKLSWPLRRPSSIPTAPLAHVR